MSFKKLQISSAAFLISMLVSIMSLANPLSGAYTIGGVSPSYATFNAAVTDLIANGINGAVIFNVRPGTYNERVKITSVTGVSSINLVTFQSETGNASDVTITYGATGTSDNYVVDLNGVSYITFSQITIQASGSSYSTAINIENNATYNKLEFLVVTAPVVSSNSINNILINLDGDGTLCNYNKVYHSTLTGGSYGVYSVFSYYGGSSYNYGEEVMYNSFVNQYAGAINMVRCLTGATIKYNTITTNAANSSYNGIKINIQQDTVSHNKIYKCPGTGIYFENCSPYISNNFVEIEGTGVNYGISHKWNNYCADVVFVSGNTVLVKNTNTQSAAFYLPWPGYAWNFPFNFIRNNIFVNRGGGYAIFLENNGSVTTPNPYGKNPIVDYNNYYTTGTYIGRWGGPNTNGGIDCTTLANWQSTINSCACGADAHSLNIDPNFISDYDLHLAVDNVRSGAPAPETGTKDIDGDIRDVATPNMGADEMTGPQPLLSQFSSNNTVVCKSNTISFSDNSTGSPVSWKWTFSGGTPGSSTSQNPSVTYNTPGNFDVKLVVTNANGKDSLTKSGYITVNPLPGAGSVTANPATVCSGGSAQLTVTGFSGTIQWQSSGDGTSFTNIPGSSSAVYNTGILTQGTYYRVKVSNSCGVDSSTVKQVTVIPPQTAGTISAASDTICAGTPANLSVTGSSGSIQWQSSSTAGNFSNISGATGTSYLSAPSQKTYFRVYASNGPCNDTSTVFTLIVKTAPVAAFTWTANGLQITFNSNGSVGATVYNWDFGDSTTSTAANPTHSFSRADSFHVCLKIFNNTNCSYTVCHDMDVITGVTAQHNEGDFIIFPNPFSGGFVQVAGRNDPVISIEVQDLMGRTVYRRNDVEQNDPARIDLLGLSNGIYFLNIKTNEKNYIRKIVKQ